MAITETKQDTYVEEVENGGSVEKISTGELNAAALAATETEHQMTIREAIRTWPKAVIFSIIFLMCVVMEGYDTILIPSLIGYPAFKELYGKEILIHSGANAGKIVKDISARDQSLLNGMLLVTQIIGVLVGGPAIKRFGYRPCFLFSLTAIIGILFGIFFSANMTQLIIFEALAGLPWGFFSTAAPAYASEIAPVAVRSQLTAFTNASWCIGQVLATGILTGLVHRTDAMAVRIPFALQWIWPVPLMIGIYFAPESPWWLQRKGRQADARRALERLTSPGKVDIDAYLAMIVKTNEVEAEATKNATYFSCFNRANIRRTEISCLTWVMQQLSGSPFAGSSIYFFTTVGLSSTAAYSLGAGQFAIGVCGTFVSWVLMAYFSKRNIILVTMSMLVVIMTIVGACSIPGTDSATWAQASFMFLFVAVYDVFAPVTYSVIAEVPSVALRNKTIGLARIIYNIVGLLAGTIQPYFINNSSDTYIGGKVGFIWAACGLMCVTYTFFRIPNMDKMTFWEIQKAFDAGTPARQFGKTRYTL
ncbi:hypothetical protein PYCC9005_005888 [Savitreella phatthalungensis]